MGSFQKDGRLFDGYGVTPDIPVAPVPEYFLLREHDRDVQLEAAIAYILNGKTE